MEPLMFILVVLMWPAAGVLVFSLMCILHGWPDEYERKYSTLYILLWPVTLVWGTYHYVKYGGK